MEHKTVFLSFCGFEKVQAAGVFFDFALFFWFSLCFENVFAALP